MSIKGKQNRLSMACPCSCFESGTRIWAYSPNASLPSWVNADAFTTEHSAVSMDDSATRKDMKLTKRETMYTTSGPETTPLYVFVTEDGKELAVTQHHGIVLSDGTVTTASQVTLADELLGMDGRAVALRTINRRTTENNAYNFLTRGKTKQSHLVIAEGLVVGDLSWQNSLDSEFIGVAIRE